MRHTSHRINKLSNSSQGLCVHHLLEAQVVRNPDATAITAPGRLSLTYSGLSLLVQETMNKMNSLGIGGQDRIAIVLPNGPEMATAFLAVTACATSAPLNPSYTESEFDFYLSDLNAKALLIQSGMDSLARTAARSLGIPIIELSPTFDAEAGVFSLTGKERSQATYKGFAEPDDVALVLHTSGTTSQPKLVPLTQDNICSSALNIMNTLALGESDRCMNVMPLFHIHGLIGAVLSSLVAGACVICTQSFDSATFYKWMEEFQPTWYTAVPTIHQAILEFAPHNREIIARCPLRLIRSSSSTLPAQVMAELEREFGVPVIEAYGMTEASHQITSNPLLSGRQKPRSVGVAAGSEVGVINSAGNLLEPGESGEIIIRGASITKGYENNPAANESSLINGWFRTGDQGFIDNEGYLFITGRLKEIINRGGEKVSPLAIDESLMNHPDIKQAVAFAVSHPTLGEDIAAAVVLWDNSSITEPIIREWLFGKLADFKIPSQVLVVDKIPKGATGKVQRMGLAEKFADQLRREYVSPNSAFEIMVASIYEEVLDIEPLGLNDNFFALGGDSLKATQVMSRIRAIFEMDLPIVTIFKKPTVKELSKKVMDSMDMADITEISTILDELNHLDAEDAQHLLDIEPDLDKNMS